MIFTVSFESITGHSYCPEYENLFNGIAAYDKAVELGYVGPIESLVYDAILIRENPLIKIDYKYAKESGKFQNKISHVVYCKNGILNKFTSYYLCGYNLVHYIDYNLIVNEWKRLGYIDRWQ